ncbi:VWA domain-containing protein [Humibacter ginsenosidimutans]|uniref:VWA domain-containing protein n=1 Tax=Humibacter ginsenosidimutans TaxID=2599293 RepID=A0A5B8M3R8_9MICO|nr:VWA domain-containing protein [Humibacter ginsenosidimutans]QDZ15003.1 VWA domain-containing protein [Humibacter ginsenosidimutans]
MKLALMITPAVVVTIAFGGLSLPAHADDGSSSTGAQATQSGNDATATGTPTDSPSSSPSSTTPTDDATASPTSSPPDSPSATPTESGSSSATSTPAPTDPSTPEPTQSGGPKLKAQAITPLVVPAPTATTSVVTVKVGGDRSGVTGVTSLAGVTLGLYAAQTGGAALFTCVSDADGDCNFTVTATGPGGTNRNKQFWVRQASTGVPTGWVANTSLRTGNGDGTGSQSTPYAFQTPALLGGQTYSSTQTGSNGFMLGSGNTTRLASGGIWQQSRANPTLIQQCGLKVALVLDLSGSVGDDIGDLKGAADTFTDSLVGTASSMALFSFSTLSPASGATQNYPGLMPVTTQAQANAFQSLYADWTSGGGTNWDRGLASAAANASDYNVVVVITDGSPTYYNDPQQGPGNFTRAREVENGIFSANEIKSDLTTRVIAVGVGSGVSSASAALNLAAISGPVAYNGSNTAAADYYQTDNYGEVGTALRNLALGNCAGTVSVVKEVVPSTAPPGSTDGAQPAGGWTFDASADNGVTVSPSTGETASGTGAIGFGLAFPGGTPSADFTATETQQDGFTLQQVSGMNAVCTDLNTGLAVTVRNSGSLGFTARVGSDQAVSCTVYNRAASPTADVTLSKQWVINGQTYADPNQPAAFLASATLTGPGSVGATPQPWNVVRTGYSVNDTAQIDENTTIIGPTLCTVDSSKVTSVNGATTDAALPYTATLTQEHNTVTVTNTVTCDTKLTLVKQVQGGDADPSEWTLTGIAPDGALPGPSGHSGVSASVTPNVTYQLAESGGDPLYKQVDERTNLQSNPLSTGSMTCVQVDAEGNVIAGYSDGINGGVSVPLGFSVRCTAVNQTATLILEKQVINDNGGSAVPGDWQLTATPTGTVPSGVVAQTVTGSLVGESFNVLPGQTYALSEQGPSGYTQTALTCSVNDGPFTADSAATVSLDPLQTVVCRFVNDDVAPTLSLVKQVGGEVVPATNWTLTGAPASGDSPTVTGNGSAGPTAVSAGVDYDLSEAPISGFDDSQFEAGDWVCTDSSGGSTTVQAGDTTGTATLSALNPGQVVTCTIENDAVQQGVTIDKTVHSTTQNADGSWTIVYDITVTNASTYVATAYDLTDSLSFGTGITVNSASWTGPTSGTFSGTDAVLTSTRELAAAASDVFVVTVNATVADSAWTSGSTKCTEEGGGFYNEATALSNDRTVSDDACSEPTPPTPTPTPTPTGTTPPQAGNLPGTGSDIWPLVGGGGVLVVIGAALMSLLWWRRRNRGELG